MNFQFFYRQHFSIFEVYFSYVFILKILLAPLFWKLSTISYNKKQKYSCSTKKRKKRNRNQIFSDMWLTFFKPFYLRGKRAATNLCKFCKKVCLLLLRSCRSSSGRRVDPKLQQGAKDCLLP